MNLKYFVQRLVLIVFLVSMAYPSVQAYGAEPVKIGVLAFRPKPQTLAQWQPLAAVLKQTMPERDFVIEAFDYAGLDQAVASRQLDFVLTNSGHYVFLKKRSGLSSPLATVIALNKNSQPSPVYGGVIFTRAGQADINTLQDIKGKTVATVTLESFAGYQMQAYELSRLGIRMPQEVKLVTTGMPHDKVVEAVLAGQAEVGFVRTAVLEGMASNGKLDFKQLKILNSQNLPGFTQQLSTHLYPEWPFAAMPQTDEDLARHVAAVLFTLGDNTAATHTMEIHGFTVPADYSAVEELLRELRLPPYDFAPRFTLYDVWSHYRWQIVGALGAAGLIVLLGMRLFFANRRLVVKQDLLLQQQQRIEEDEEKFRTVADYTFDWEYWQGPQDEILYMTPSCEQVTGYSRAEFIANPDLLKHLIHSDDRHLMAAHRHDIDNQEDGTLDFRIVRRDGGIRWIEHICHPVWNSDEVFKGRRVSNRDITGRLEAEEARSQLSVIIERSLNEIYLFDAETLRFKHVNQGALKNIQYTLEELKGMTPVDIKPLVTETSFRAMIQPLLADEQDVLVFETVHRRADGSLYPVEAHLQLVGSGQQRTFLAVIFDITKRKHLEEEKAEVEAKYHQLQKAESLGRMAGAIAHNYNNMLAVVIGNLELGMANLPPDAELTNKCMTAALKGARRAAEVSSLMLTYLGQTPGTRELLDLSELCSRTLPMLRGTMPAEVQVEADLSTPGPCIKASAREIQQILSNLVTNAWEALCEKPGVIHLSVKMVPAAEIPVTHRFPLDWIPQDDVRYACLEVTDSGCGIMKEIIDTLLFDPFYTTKFTGRGLGLPVVLGIVRTHHGAITVESEMERGSVFRVFFPLSG